MSSDPGPRAHRVEVITLVQRRRRWSVAEKVRLVEEAMQPGMSVPFDPGRDTRLFRLGCTDAAAFAILHGPNERLRAQAPAVARAAPSLQALSDKAGFSPFHFHRLFKAATGLTPKAHEAAARSARMRSELDRSPSLTDAIQGAGHSSSRRFCVTLQARLGMTPRLHRTGAPPLAATAIGRGDDTAFTAA